MYLENVPRTDVVHTLKDAEVEVRMEVLKEAEVEALKL